MQLNLTEPDARHLHNLLKDCLPGLRRELAATDMSAHELRHELAERMRLCERLIAQLAKAPQHA